MQGVTNGEKKKQMRDGRRGSVDVVCHPTLAANRFLLRFTKTVYASTNS